jgi:hypothetical protein
MKALSLLLLFSMVSVGSHAQASDPNSTERMLEMCRSPGEGYGYCAGFISGTAMVMEAVGVSTSGEFRGAFGMCVSTPYPSGNAEVAAFISWAQRNPQFGGMPSANGVMTALAITWPCAEQR